MQINNTMRKYIEEAVNERIDEKYPTAKRDSDFKDGIKTRTLDSIQLTQVAHSHINILLRALLLACADLLAEKARTIPPSAADLEAFMAWHAEQKAKRAEEQEAEHTTFPPFLAHSEGTKP